MLSGINFDSVLSVGGLRMHKKSSQATGSGCKECQNYDQFELLKRSEGLEKEQNELVGYISREIRTRPTNGQLEELKRRIQEGIYQPNPQEIAARVLFLRKENF